MIRPKRSFLLSLFLLLVFVPAAQAISYTPAAPAVGDPVTFTTGGFECPGGGNFTATFSVDGVPKQASSSTTFTTSFSADWTYTVTLTIQNASGQSCGGTQTVNVTVTKALSGMIIATPDSPAPNQTVALAATQSGGTPGYTWAWDLDNDGAFDDNAPADTTPRTQDTVFTTLGDHVVKVRITDEVPPPDSKHTEIVTKTITVKNPPPAPTPAPGETVTPTPVPTATPCTQVLAFDLSEFKTEGCFKKVSASPERWETTDAVRLNGITFPDFGQTFTITFPMGTEPGRFKAPDSTIQLGGFKAFSGDIDWALPKGGQGGIADLKTISIALGSKMFGLNVKGSTAIRLGWDAGGHYATFPLTIEMPAGIEAGPNYEDSRATGGASLRVDDAGPHFDGLRLAAKNVWAGKLKLVEACFSFIPAGGDTLKPCPTPSVGGREYIGCNTDITTDRWDGNAIIELPSANHPQIAAFGGLAGGQVSKLGGIVDRLGNAVPLSPGVFLNRIGVGLCLSPPPVKFRGDVGIGILPIAGTPSVTVDGTVTYTDPFQSQPWTLEFGGEINVRGTRVGTGSVTLRASGGINFQLQAGFNLFGVASLEGQIEGWVDTVRQMYSVSGSVRACISGDDICAQGSGIVSNLGTAGCVTVVSNVPDYGTLIISLDPFGVRFNDRPTYISAGFGYRWGDSWPELFGGSCNFSAYRPVRQFRQLAGGAITQKVKPGTIATSWRIHGTGGAPPKVIVRGPDGFTIQSPMDATSAQDEGKWMLAENTPEGTTNVLLIQPKAGTYTIEGVMGAMSAPERIDVSESEAPPTVAAKVRGSGDRRKLEVAYAVPEGASLRLAEVGEGVSKTIVASLKGSRCPQTPKTRPGTDQAVLCAHVPFTVSRGPGGKRTIEAIVTRDGVPISQTTVASYVAPKETLPAPATALRLQRKKGTLRFTFPRLRGAVRYVATAKLSDGRSLGFDLGPACRQLVIPSVPANVGGTVTIAGLRYDLAGGKERGLKIKRNKKSAQTKSKLPKTKGKLKVCT